MSKLIEIQVPHSRDPEYGHLVLEWLDNQGKEPYKHYDLDMHGGKVGYTSFYFRNRILAIRTLLEWT